LSIIHVLTVENPELPYLLAHYNPCPLRMVSLRSLVAGIAFIVVPIIATLTPSQVADGLEQMAHESLALEPTANSISILNAPLIIIGQGPFPVRHPTPKVS
jgi:hypothetical protein